MESLCVSAPFVFSTNTVNMKRLGEVWATGISKFTVGKDAEAFNNYISKKKGLKFVKLILTPVLTFFFFFLMK